jgi:hypothetical protein
MILEYVALGIMCFVGLVLFYGLIAVHDIPYEIAKKRGHPHLEALHIAGWVSMFTLHAIWPFLWIWAFMYTPEKGYGFSPAASKEASEDIKGQLTKIEERLGALEKSAAKRKG